MSLHRVDPNAYVTRAQFINATVELADFVIADNVGEEYHDPDLWDLRDRLVRERHDGADRAIETAKEICDKLHDEYDRQDVPYLWEE